jgi:hypothetical protein
VRGGEGRYEAADVLAMALLTDNAIVGISEADEQFKTSMAIAALIFIERHRNTPLLAEPFRAGQFQLYYASEVLMLPGVRAGKPACSE